MADDPKIVALLRFYADERAATRLEVSVNILGKASIGYVAGIHNRNKRVIGQWPPLDPTRRKNRRCQFPIGDPLVRGFDVCGKKRKSDPLVCDEHKGMIWKASP